ncbi:hypothetical protein [Vibrio intestinalis]|uniref:hypothetical protein n=1 Tax=Vibrio intestinalis TaxID=2933291 RepID=UPI0021A8E2C5|nr:hypothetical protein [Vibrio intestinalis]
MPQKYRYIGMFFFLLFSVFMCWFSYKYLYIGFQEEMAQQSEFIEVSFGSGLTIYSSVLFFTYSVAFLLVNINRRRDPIELWEKLSSTKTTILIIGLLSVSIPCGYIYKEYKEHVLAENGYSLNQVRERHGLFKLDHYVYSLSK